jgi:hypothetical protein
MILSMASSIFPGKMERHPEPPGLFDPRDPVFSKAVLIRTPSPTVVRTFIEWASDGRMLAAYLTLSASLAAGLQAPFPNP